MTLEQIYDGLRQTPQDQLLQMKNLLEEETKDNRLKYAHSFKTKTPTAIDYLIQAVIRHNSNSIKYKNPFNWSEMQLLTLSIPSNLLDNLPVNILHYLPKNIVTSIKTKINKQLLLDKAKDLQLNQFSYIAYEAAIKSGKKLSSTEAIAQISKLPSPKTVEESKLYDKFLALLWENVSKRSIQFCDTILLKNKRSEHAPIESLSIDYRDPSTAVSISRYFNLNSYKPHAHIPIHFYQRVAVAYNIPILKEGHTDVHSRHHNWITGVDKSKPLNKEQLEMTLSQIMILDYIIKYIQRDNICPYFTQMKDHLIKEIGIPIYKDKINKLQLDKAYTSTQETINGLVQIHN